MAERIPLIYTPGIRQEYYVSRNSSSSASHNRLMYVFHQAGFEPYFNQPNWRESDPRRWPVSLAKYAKEIVRDRENKGVVLAGFSAGSLIALQATELLEQSSEVQVEGVLGASVSPYVGKAWLSRTRYHPNSDVPTAMSISQQHVFSELELPKVKTQIQLYVGTGEIDSVRAFHEVLLYQIPQAESIKPPCAHNILDESYVEAIRQNVGRLRTNRSS